MKRLTVLILVFAIAFSMLLTGCEKQAEDNEIRIGISVYDEHDTFIQGLMEAFNQYVSEEKVNNGRSISILNYNAAGNQSTQNDQAADMISKGCDVICINLVDRTDASTIISMAREADTPVIFFNRELVADDLQSWGKLYYVGADAYESGEMQGSIAADLCNSNPSVDRNGDGSIQTVIIEGEPGHQDAIVRTESCINQLEEEGVTVDLLDDVIANWNRAQAQTKMSQLIDTYGDGIELILANNDDMAVGAISEYDSREIPEEDRPVIVGIDGTDIGLSEVVDGKMYGTVYNDKEGQAEALFNLAIAASTGSDMSSLGLQDGKYIRLPYAPVTMDNVYDYYYDTETSGGND